MEDEILTRKEAAAWLKVSLSHFSKIQNNIKQIKLGKSVRFRKSDIEEYLKSVTEKGK